MSDRPSWKLRLQTGRLERLTTEVGGVWKDAAARQVHLRYLQPHATEAAQMAAALAEQEAHHATAVVAEAVVVAQAQVAADASDLCLTELREAEQQRTRLYDQLSIALRLASSAHSAAEAAEMHARAAQSACAGCPGDDGAVAPMVAITPRAALPSALAPTRGQRPALTLPDGLEWFDIEQLDLSHNPIQGDFGRGELTKDDYLWGARTWRDVVLPGLERGLTGDDFATADRDAGRHAGARRVHGAYEMFLGSDPIRVDRKDGRWQIGGGRHRVTVLRESGVRWAPVRIERVD